MPWRPRARSGAIGERVAVARFGLLEQAGRPERVAVERQRLGIARRDLDQRFGFVPRARRTRRRAAPPGRCPDARPRAIVGRAPRASALLIGLERVLVPAFGEELRRRAGAGFRADCGLRRHVGVDDERRSGA